MNALSRVIGVVLTTVCGLAGFSPTESSHGLRVGQSERLEHEFGRLSDAGNATRTITIKMGKDMRFTPTAIHASLDGNSRSTVSR
jgi:hypothetical protein